MKKVIALRGISSCGKSSTFRVFYGLLAAKYPTFNILPNPEPILTNDIRFVVVIGKYKIGIEAQGDPNSRIFRTIDIFVEIEVDIIICATRTRGRTANKVKDLQKQGFEIKWINKHREADPSLHSLKNEESAHTLLTQLEAFLA